MGDTQGTKVEATPAPVPAAAIGVDVLARRAAIFYEQGHFEAARQLELEIVCAAQCWSKKKTYQGY